MLVASGSALAAAMITLMPMDGAILVGYALLIDRVGRNSPCSGCPPRLLGDKVTPGKPKATSTT